MISFKILTEESGREMLGLLSDLSKDADMEFFSEIIEDMLHDDCEYALCHSDLCLLVRVYDGEYSFVYPLSICDEADVEAAIDKIRAYTVKEEIKLIFCDVPSGELGRLLPLFRHVNIDAADPDGECYTVRVISEASMLDEMPTVEGDGTVSLTPLTEEDDEPFFRLCTDRESNKYWGYDYSLDVSDPTLSYFRESAEGDFDRGMAISLAVRVGDSFAGEATLYGFDLLGGCECAVRLLPEFRHNGYATLALELLKELAGSIGLVYFSATVDQNNQASIKMTKKCLDEIERGEDKVKFRAYL